jgi:hypothetical protein
MYSIEQLSDGTWVPIPDENGIYVSYFAALHAASLLNQQK